MKAFTFNLLNLHLQVQNMKLFQIGKSFHIRIELLKYGWMVTVFVSMGQGSVVPDVLSNTEADS